MFRQVGLPFPQVMSFILAAIQNQVTGLVAILSGPAEQYNRQRCGLGHWFRLHVSDYAQRGTTSAPSNNLVIPVMQESTFSTFNLPVPAGWNARS